MRVRDRGGMVQATDANHFEVCQNAPYSIILAWSREIERQTDIGIDLVGNCVLFDDG